MKRRMIRFCSLFLCGLLCLSMLPAALADPSFCPALFALADRYRAGETMALTLTGKINKLLPFESDELSIINGVLADSALTLAVSSDGAGKIVLSRAGEEAVSFAYRDEYVSLNGETMLLGPLAQEQLIPQEQPDILNCLNGLVKALPQLEAVVSAFAPAKTVSGTTISNLGTVREGRAYTLTSEQAQLTLQQAMTVLAAYTDMDQVTEALSACAASGEVTLTFYATSSGRIVSCEAFGPVLVHGDSYNFRVMIAMNDTGINSSVNVVAVEGKGLFRCSVKGKITESSSSQKDLYGSFEYTTRTDNSKYSLTGEATLSCRFRSEGDALSGRITWTETDGKTERTYILRPDLTITSSQAAGTLAVVQKKGETILFSTELNALLAPAEPIMADAERPSRVDAYATERVDEALLTFFAGQMKALDQQDMYLLTHALRSDAWMAFTADLSKEYTIFDFQLEE